MALAELIGPHDFKSFQNTGTDLENTVREILRAQLILHDPKFCAQFPWMPPENLPLQLIEIQIEGTGFLKTLGENKFQGFGSNYSFSQFPADSGFENKFVYILKYKDYQLLKAN